MSVHLTSDGCQVAGGSRVFAFAMAAVLFASASFVITLLIVDPAERTPIAAVIAVLMLAWSWYVTRTASARVRVDTEGVHLLGGAREVLIPLDEVRGFGVYRWRLFGPVQLYGCVRTANGERPIDAVVGTGTKRNRIAEIQPALQHLQELVEAARGSS